MRIQEEGKGVYTKRVDYISQYLISIIKRYFEELDNNSLNSLTREAIIQECINRIKEDLNNYITEIVKKEIQIILNEKDKNNAN